MPTIKCRKKIVQRFWSYLVGIGGRIGVKIGASPKFVTEPQSVDFILRYYPECQISVDTNFQTATPNVAYLQFFGIIWFHTFFSQEIS